VTVEIASS